MSTSTHPTPRRPVLRDLPLSARVVITVFLMSVGLGYFCALAQLHFKHASPGEKMPTPADVVAKFSGVDYESWKKGTVEEPPAPQPPAAGLPKAGPGGIKGDVAPTGAAAGGINIYKIIEDRCLVCHGPGGDKEDVPLEKYEHLADHLKPEPAKSHLFDLLTAPPGTGFGRESMVQAFTTRSPEWKDEVRGKSKEEVDQLKQARDKERLQLVAWVEAGAPEYAYQRNASWNPALKAEAAPRKRSAKSRQMSVEALAQSTHVHMLGFSMLYGLSGLILAFSSYPGWVRLTVAPMALLMQVIDIACWWLARLDGIGPYFALGVMATGGIVAASLFLQLVLSLLDLYGRGGKVVLLALFVAAGFGGYTLYTKVIEPQLAAEKQAVAQAVPGLCLGTDSVTRS